MAVLTKEFIGEYYEANRERLVKTLLRRAGSPENAEDIVQEAFLRALKYYESAGPRADKIDEWFGTLCNNALIDLKKAERICGAAIDIDECEPTPFEVDFTDERTATRIKWEIDKRKGTERDVLYLYFIKEHSPSDIQCVLGIGVNSVKWYVRKFKEEMNALFKGV